MSVSVFGGAEASFSWSPAKDIMLITRDRLNRGDSLSGLSGKSIG